MATRLPYYVSEGDIYSRIMGQQAAPSAMTDYYAGFTGGYDPGLYQRRRASTAVTGPGSDVPGLLDTGGGGGDLDASGGVSGNPADAIALGQALSAYGGLLGGFAPGGFLAGLAGKGLTSSGITALGKMEAQAAQMANDQAAMDALAGLSNAAVGQGEAQAIADALANESGLAVAADAQAVANAALDAQAAADMQAALDAVAAAEAQAAADAQAADATAAADVAAMGDVGMGAGPAGGYAAADGVGQSGFDSTGNVGASDGGGGGGGGSGCFLTTAAVEHMGDADDGDVLNTLRKFRDQFMLADKSKRADVAAYYKHAPQIVEALNANPNAKSIYQQMYREYILPAVQAIKAGDNKKAYRVYVKGVEWAARKAMIKV